MRLSEKRRQAIYAAVSTRIMDVRVELAKLAREGRQSPEKVDHLLFRLSDSAGQAAIHAAERGKGE